MAMKVHTLYAYVNSFYFRYLNGGKPKKKQKKRGTDLFFGFFLLTATNVIKINLSPFFQKTELLHHGSFK